MIGEHRVPHPLIDSFAYIEQLTADYGQGRIIHAVEDKRGGTIFRPISGLKIRPPFVGTDSNFSNWKAVAIRKDGPGHPSFPRKFT